MIAVPWKQERYSKGRANKRFLHNNRRKLANELPDNQHTEEENYTTCPSEIMTAPIIQDIKTDREFLQKQLKSIKPEKASGPDNIRPKDFKLAEESIIEGLDIVIQKTKQTRKMPSKCKTGEVKVE